MQAAPPQSSTTSEAQTNSVQHPHLDSMKNVELATVTSNQSQTSTEATKPKEYAYGPKANKNNATQPSNEGSRRTSGPGPTARPPFDQDNRRVDNNLHPIPRTPMETSPVMSGPKTQPSHRPANEAWVPAREASSYRPDPPARDAAWLNNGKAPVSSRLVGQ